MRRIVPLLLIASICCRDRENEVKTYAATHSDQLVDSTRSLWIKHKPPSTKDITTSELPVEVRTLTGLENQYTFGPSSR